MDWFYAVNDERKGPVNDAQLPALISSGKISPDTLVWNHSMADWKPAGQTSLFPPKNPVTSSARSAPRPGEHLCVITGKSFPPAQMIKTEHGWVSAEGKDVYYQSLREGAPIPLASGQTNARADGKNIVVPVADARLPQRCVKTNQPVTEDDVKRKAFYWCTPAIFFAILINLLVVIILHYVFRKKVMIDLPLSRQGQAIVTKNKIIAWLTFFAGLAMFIAGMVSAGNEAGSAMLMLIPVGLVVLLFGLAFGGRKGVALRVVKLKNGNAWLAGASKEYLASLPSYL
jgi:hypothetical protein